MCYLSKSFEREVYVWGKLSHANVLPLLGCAYNNVNDPLLISEWMDNGCAREYINGVPDCDVLQLVNNECSVPFYNANVNITLDTGHYKWTSIPS